MLANTTVVIKASLRVFRGSLSWAVVICLFGEEVFSSWLHFRTEVMNKLKNGHKIHTLCSFDLVITLVRVLASCI